MKRRTGIYLIYILAVLLIPAVAAYTGTPGGLPDPDPFPDKEAEQLTLTESAINTAVRSRLSHSGEKQNRTGTACTMPLVSSSVPLGVMAAPVT